MRFTVELKLVCCALGLLLASLGEVGAATAATYGPMPQVQGTATWVPRVAPERHAAAPLVAGGPIVNGGFEAGDFTGWTVVDQSGGAGSWFVYSGTASPVNGATIAAPPQGTFAAVTDQTGPGSHILFQDVTLAPSSTHTLTFFLYYLNQNGVFATPATLDYMVSPNQQYRVDVMDPSAPVDSVTPGDVLANLFQTNVGDPPSIAPTLMTFDLTPFAGRTVRLRFAEADNQFFFEASVDAVAIRSTPSTPVPTMGPFGLAIVVLALLAIGAFRLTHNLRRAE